MPLQILSHKLTTLSLHYYYSIYYYTIITSLVARQLANGKWHSITSPNLTSHIINWNYSSLDFYMTRAGVP